jgi:hypothetical protein
MKHVLAFIILVGYIAGIVLAKGFWLTTAAIFFAPYSLYLVVEKLMMLGGLN